MIFDTIFALYGKFVFSLFGNSLLSTTKFYPSFEINVVKSDGVKLIFYNFLEIIIKYIDGLIILQYYLLYFRIDFENNNIIIRF